jgi:UPF0271 protein
MVTIDLNCDIGESPDAEQLAREERILEYVTSVNLACGVHAGSPRVMRRLIRLARIRGVAIGAHPGYPDVDSKGRRPMTLPSDEVEAWVAYQVGALAGIAALEGARVAHVKPHGALYNQAARDQSLAESVARAVVSVDRRLLLYGLAGSCVIEAAERLGLTAVEEGFADRAYRADGTLVPRSETGAVLHDEREVVERALRLVGEGVVASADGQEVRAHVDTICLHADTDGSDRLAERVRQALEAAGFRVAAPAAQ